MRKISVLMAAAASVAAACVSGSASAAPVITFTADTGSSSPSPTAGYTVVQSFDNCAVGANTACSNLSGNYHIYNGNVPNNGAVPFPNDSTNYLSVLSSDTGGATYTFANPVGAVEFDWGTAASTDTLTIYEGNNSFTYNVPNSTAGSGANYNQNGLLTITADPGTTITKLNFAATQNSFEVDNIAAVPEPAAWGMMILGFGMVGGVLRRRKSVQGTLRMA